MKKYDFEESVGCWVTMTARALRRALDAELAREQITFRQWEVLACLSLDGDVSQSDMAERLGIEAPTLAGVLTRMERDGWLERRACPSDRRKKRLDPTPKAEAVWSRMIECCRRIRAQATDGVTAEELTTLRRVCERIRENLTSTPEHVWNETVSTR